MRVAKPNLGSTADAVDRHARDATLSLRKKREERLKERRGPTTSTVPTAELVLQLQNNNNVNLLLECLRRQDADAYFAPSKLYDYKGPYLFPTTASLKYLVDIYDTNCLINVAAHEETFTWCNRLIECGVIDAIKSHPITENVVFLMTNMCFDSAEVRDRMLELLPLINVADQFPEACARLFASLFCHSPAPPPEVVRNFWRSIIHFSSNDVIRGVVWACREQAYRTILIQSNLLGMFRDAVDIWVQMSADEVHRTDLIDKYDMIENLYRALVHSDPTIREKGACGLSYISESKLAFQRIFDNIASIMQQIEHCRDYPRIQKPLYRTLCNLTQNLPNRDAFCILIDLKIFFHLRHMLTTGSLGDNNLKLRALKAIKILSRFNASVSRRQMEEYELIDEIDILTTHVDMDVAAEAESIVGYNDREQDMDVD